MKALIQHLVREHLAEITAKSLLNCHVPGLHSIMLMDTPEHRVRLFIATATHELWRNSPLGLGSLAAHPHHCAITLHVIKGFLVNLGFSSVTATRPPLDNRPFTAYRYKSGILTDSGAFVRVDEPPVFFSSHKTVKEGESLALPAEQIHSVQVMQGAQAAWFVYEGKEDANYSSLSYSNENLEAVDFSNLYQLPRAADVVWLLNSVNLL